MTTNDKLADALDELCDAVRVYDRCPDKYNHNAMTEARAAVASLAAPPAQGEWVMVPRIPTPEMDAAGKLALSDNGIGDLVDSDALICYAAMLAARPHPAPAPVQVDVLGELADEIEATYPNTDASNLRAFAAQPPAPGEAELPPLPDSFARCCADGYWLLRAAGTQRFDVHDSRYTPAQEVYSSDQMHAYARAAIAALAQQRVPDADGCHGLDTPERVCFYEQDFYVLSNFSSFKVYIFGEMFDTSEAAYHWAKFSYCWHVQNAIKMARSAHEAFKIAERNKDDRRDDWDNVKVDVMREILRAKAHQHEYVRRKLLATGDRELVENSWRDDYWGWGPNRDGKNMLGKLWMEVRAELRSIDQQQEARGNGE